MGRMSEMMIQQMEDDEGLPRQDEADVGRMQREDAEAYDRWVASTAAVEYERRWGGGA